MPLLSVLWTVACILATVCSVIWFASGHIALGMVWATVAVMDLVMVALVDD